jgi:hypothetical protein
MITASYRDVNLLVVILLLERFPIVRSTAVMVLLWAGGPHGAVFDGLAHPRAGRL